MIQDWATTTRRALALILLTGCGAEPVPVFWIDARTDDYVLGSFQRIDDACAFWDIDCEETDDDRCGLFVLLLDYAGEASDGTPRCGETVSEPGSPFVFACDDFLALEHEIGHAFGLNHRDDADNVMFFNANLGGDETTRWQERLVRSGASALARRCQ